MNTMISSAGSKNGSSRILRVPPREQGNATLGVLSRNTGSSNKRLPPVLLVHGATFGSGLFDLPLPGYSLMEELAQGDRPVYALDVRGYGHSLGGREMNSPADSNPPFARLDDAAEDVGTVVEFILRTEAASAVHLVGFSWGTVVCARYVEGHRQYVSRLVLCAPLYAETNPMWLERIGDPLDRSKLDSRIGAYRLIRQADIRQRWDADIGSSRPDLLREDQLPNTVFEALASLDPLAYSHDPPAFRAPTGALADLIGVFNGRAVYDPSRITMPVLLIRGSDDTTSTDTDAKALLGRIGSREKQYQVVSPGSHFLCVEKNRTRLYQSINAFLRRADLDVE
jgi:pimeloyl-ACP methyl ester carboxylesterase